MSHSIRDGFGDMMVKLGQSHPDLMVLSADLSDSLRLSAFKNQFPHQYLEVGVSEQNLIGVAAGLAMSGKTVVATSFAAFNPGRNWDQIRLSVCEQNLDIKIIGGHAGLATGADGATHQMLEDLALMTVLPRMRVVVPADYQQAQDATAALVTSFGPAYLRLSRAGTTPLPADSATPFRLGEGQVLRSGSDATIIACGLLVDLALQAATILEDNDHLHVGVINLATLKPLDTDLLTRTAQQTPVIVTAEEHQLTGGLASLVATHLAHTHPTIIESVAVRDTFGTSGSQNELFARYGLTVDAIIAQVKRGLARLPSAAKH
jgi:transketolase